MYKISFINIKLIVELDEINSEVLSIRSYH